MDYTVEYGDGWPEVFDGLGVELLRAQPGSLILMDELGFLEQDAAAFRREVLRCLDGSIPVLAVILDQSKLPTVLGFLFLYLLGGYFRRFGLEHPNRWLAVGIVSAIISIISTATPYREPLLSFFSPNAALSGGACFVLYMTRQPPQERFRSLLAQASDCTMGVYLLHPLVSKLLKPRLRPLQAVIFPAGYMVLVCVCIFSAAFAAVWLLSRSKPVKRILF